MKLQYRLYAWLGPLRTALRVFVEKGSAPGHLSPIQVATEVQVHTSGSELAFNNLRIPPLLVDRLYHRERRAGRAPNQQERLLFLE